MSVLFPFILSVRTSARRKSNFLKKFKQMKRHGANASALSTSISFSIREFIIHNNRFEDKYDSGRLLGSRIRDIISLIRTPPNYLVKSESSNSSAQSISFDSFVFQSNAIETHATILILCSQLLHIFCVISAGCTWKYWSNKCAAPQCGGQ